MRKKRKRKSRRNDLASFKQVETEGVDFLPFLAGLITSLAIIFLVWNEIATSLGTGSESPTEPVTTATETLPKLDDFEAVILAGNSDQLADLLLELKLSLVSKRLDEQVEVNQQRIQVADRMLENELEPRQEVFAKSAKLDSLAKNYGIHYMYGFGSPSIVDNFRALAESFLQEPYPKLVREARLDLIKIHVLERAKSQLPGSMAPMADEIIELMKKYPADEFVVSTIGLTLQANLEMNQQVGVNLIDELRARMQEVNSPIVLDMIQDLSDKALLAKSDYDNLFENRWVNGATGQRKLLNVSKFLSEHRDAGPIVFLKVDEVAHWFDQEGRHEEAIEIYQAMLRRAETYTKPDAANAAREIATQGLRRNQLLDKKIELAGLAPDGSVIEPQQFEGRTVVVFFWSNRNSNSVAELSRFHRETGSWAGKRIDVLAVCVDDAAEEVGDLAKELDRFKFIIGDPSRDNAIRLLEQCPSSRVPRAMLIDRDGVVVDVNVPTESLKTDAEGI